MALLPRGAWSSISTGPLKLTFCKGEQGAWHRLSHDGRGGPQLVYTHTTPEATTTPVYTHATPVVASTIAHRKEKFESAIPGSTASSGRNACSHFLSEPHGVEFRSRSSPKSTRVPFNDTYRYTDWFPTALPLLMETILVMKRDEAELDIVADAHVFCWENHQ